MGPYFFEDALTGASVTCTYPGLESLAVRDEKGAVPERASLFFPGCSLINYALPLVRSVYDLLLEADEVEGISLLCCGKILSYEPDGKRVRAEFDRQLCDHVAAAGTRRIVAACPNCVAALRLALSRDERTAGIEIAALPQVLADLGYRVDADVARRFLAAEAPAACGAGAAGDAGVAGAVGDDAGAADNAGATGAEASADGARAAGVAGDGTAAEARADLVFGVHDSCPDRDTGEFAAGLRALMGPKLVVELEHNHARSQCCGSLVRAMGKFDAADAQARRRGEETLSAGAAGLVTACISCTYQLMAAQNAVPVFHYLELLYGWRIDWAHVDTYMKLRFLFDEPGDVTGTDTNPRSFVGLGSGDAHDVPGGAE